MLSTDVQKGWGRSALSISLYSKCPRLMQERTELMFTGELGAGGEWAQKWPALAIPAPLKTQASKLGRLMWQGGLHLPIPWPQFLVQRKASCISQEAGAVEPPCCMGPTQLLPRPEPASCGAGGAHGSCHPSSPLPPSTHTQHTPGAFSLSSL